MLERRLAELLRQDQERMRILSLVRSLDIECYIAAGFVRNMVWDSLHNTSTVLNDIDVIYFDRSDQQSDKASVAQSFLEQQMPAYCWQVKNQGLMHERNGDPPYTSVIDAMSYWPEKETAIAVSLGDNDELSIISAFGLESLFANCITYNPKRERQVFEERCRNKEWLMRWPMLRIVNI